MNYYEKIKNDFKTNFSDEINYILSYQLKITDKNIGLKEKKSEFIEKLGEQIKEGIPKYLEYFLDIFEDKIFFCEECKKENLNYRELKAHLIKCERKWIKNLFTVETVYEKDINVFTFQNEFIRKSDESNYITNDNKIFKSNFNQWASAKENEFYNVIEKKEENYSICKENNEGKIFQKIDIFEDNTRFFLVKGNIFNEELRSINRIILKYTFNSFTEFEKQY